MKTHPRNFPSALAWTLLVAVSVILGVDLCADSAVGVGTVLSDSMFRSYKGSLPQDPDWAKAKHTPTGQMFRIPFAVPKLEDIKKHASGWEYSGQMEFGVIGGDANERNGLYRMYQDGDTGAYLNNFSLQLKKPATGYFMNVAGGAAGQHDQYYSVQFGRYNDWKVKAWFSEIPHVFTDRYKTLWNGVGTGNLTLLPGLTPGGTATTANDNANVAAVAASSAPITLGLNRKKGGLRIDANLSETWKAYLSYTLENRKGARPFGAVWGNNGGTAPIEIPEPVDYKTQDILAGLQHVGTLNSFNLRLSASLFDNKVDTLTFEQPFRITPAAGVTTVPTEGAYTAGRFDLTPSSQAYNARAEYTRSLPDFYKGQFTAVVALGTWRQNDSLVPYTLMPNVTQANVVLSPAGAWNTTGSLSRQSTDAAIDTRLVDLTLSLNPTSDLNIKGKARYYEEDNNTSPFLAVNPNASYLDTDAVTPGNQSGGLTYNGVTGVWGRPLNNGSGQAILLGTNATPAGNIVIKSNPLSRKVYRLGPTADYRLNSTSTITGSAERESVFREPRERDRTNENKYKLVYVNKGLPVISTLRLSYEFNQRRGSRYVTNYYDDLRSSAIVPMPTTVGANVTTWAVRNNGGFRTYDLSDRDQHIGNLRIDTMLRENLDAGFSLQARAAKYPDAVYGRKRDDLTSVNFDLSYQPSPHRSVYGFYSYQLGHVQQASITPTGAVTIGQVTPLGTVTPENAAELGAAPGGAFYPLINEWTIKHKDRNHTVGAGLKQEIGRATFNADYSYSTGSTRIGYIYNPGGAITVANSVFAGSRMPDLSTDIYYLDASLRYKLTELWSVRFIYRYQKENIVDWHYQNLAASPVVLGANPAALPTAILLDGGPYDYQVSWYGVSFQYKF